MIKKELLVYWRKLAEDTRKRCGVSEPLAMAETIIELLDEIDKLRLVCAGSRLFQVALGNDDPLLAENARMKAALEAAREFLSGFDAGRSYLAHPEDQGTRKGFDWPLLHQIIVALPPPAAEQKGGGA